MVVAAPIIVRLRRLGLHAPTEGCRDGPLWLTTGPVAGSAQYCREVEITTTLENIQMALRYFRQAGARRVLDRDRHDPRPRAGFWSRAHFGPAPAWVSGRPTERPGRKTARSCDQMGPRVGLSPLSDPP